MKIISEESGFFSSTLDLLEKHLGSSVEIVLYKKTSSGYSVEDIRNGRVTGGSISSGLDLLNGADDRQTEDYKRLFNVIMNTPEGAVIRSSSMPIFDDEDNLIGCLTLNQDITKTLELERVVHNMNQYHGDTSISFMTNINSVLDNLIDEAYEHIGVPYDEMTKTNKIDFVHFLDQRGAFLVTKAGDRICELLNISKYTMYSYLDAVRNGKY